MIDEMTLPCGTPIPVGIQLDVYELTMHTARAQEYHFVQAKQLAKK